MGCGTQAGEGRTSPDLGVQQDSRALRAKEIIPHASKHATP